MARGSAPANTAATTAQTQAQTNYGNSNALFGPLSAELETNVAHPTGINPTDLARMDTAALQTGGGSTAGAVGQGALKAARTRNAGGADAAIASSARTGGEIASKGILANRAKDAQLRGETYSEGLKGLQSLFAQNLSGGNQALGIVPNAANANTNAVNSSWDWAKDLFNPIMQDASAYKGFSG